MTQCPLTLSTAEPTACGSMVNGFNREAQRAVDEYAPKTVEDVAAWVQKNLPIILTTAAFPYKAHSRRTYGKYHAKHKQKVEKLDPPKVNKVFLPDSKAFVFDPIIAFTMEMHGHLAKIIRTDSTAKEQYYFLDAVGVVVSHVGTKNQNKPENIFAVYLEANPKHDVLVTRERLYL